MAQRWRYIDRDVTWDELRAHGQEPNGTLQGLGDAPVDPPIEPPPDQAQTLPPGTYRLPAGATLTVA